MSAAPRFRLVLLVENREIRLFSLSQKAWAEWKQPIALSAPVPQEILEEFAGEPTLILVSDSHNGHLQIMQPNKKKNLETATLTHLLEEEYDIDTAAYLLGWRNFAVSRDQVQISVSGVEQEIVRAATEWITPLQPKKLWAMPFAWFISVLKSVDPAFIAVENDDTLLLSHHYLGVDDARVLKLGEVEKYIAMRQKERKETHLLYLQASEKTVATLEKKLAGNDITIQTLLPDAKQSPLLAAVSAVLERGQSALSELLSFDLDVPEMEMPMVAKAAASVAVVEDVTANEPEEEITVLDEETAQEDEAETADVATDDLEEVSSVGGLMPPVPPLVPPVPPAGAGATAVGTAAGVAVGAAAIRSASSVEILEDEDDEEFSVESVDEEEPAPVKSSRPEPREEVANIQPVRDIPVEVAAAATEIVAAQDEAEELDTLVDSSPEPVTQDVFSQLKGSGGGVHSQNGERYAPVEAKRSWKGPIIVFFVVVVLTALIGGAIFWSQQGTELMGGLPAASPTPVATASPVITPEPTATASASPAPDIDTTEVDKEELTVLVVNATGVNGLAGRVSEALGTAGWDNVQAANATGTYEDGATYVTEGLDAAVITALEEDLDRELTPGEINEPRASQFDIVIVLADE